MSKNDTPRLADKVLVEKTHNTFLARFRGRKYGFWPTRVGASVWLKQRKKRWRESENA